ncbi:MAG: hypothetical protein P8P74_06965 [Crocinitomicaceae bacterium]|nr:hypothetical protein [Crocinitomicaceae bacterium]
MLFRILLLLTILFFATPTFSQTDSTSVDTSGLNALYNKILNIDETVRNNPNRQVSNFNPSDTASLPIGIVSEIGETKYVICIDSAHFTPQGAFFNVYMALDFPGSGKPVAFAAKNIQFNPQGVIVSNGARLQLISQQEVRINPKMKIVFKDDGQNFIEWDCNGYKQAGLSLDFVFNSDHFENAITPTSPVKASMAMVVADMNNITFQLSDMTPFRIKKAKDFVFKLQNIVIDQSELTTPSGVNLPASSLQAYASIAEWKGFYAQYASVTLPNKLANQTQQQTTEVYASNLIIDGMGLSGSFGANNLFTTADGKMNDKWGFSIDQLQVDLVANHVTGGSLAGTIEVAPLDDQPFAYSASISEQQNSDKLAYSFSISPGDSGFTVNAFKSKIQLYQCSSISVQSQNDKFIPSANLSGQWTLDYTKAKVKGIEFQNLNIVTASPYLTSGIFSLVPNDPNSIDSTNLMRFPISINSVGISLTPQNNLAFSVGVELNLGDSTTNNSFSVGTTIRVITKDHTTRPNRLQYNNFTVADIGFSLATQAIEMSGVIAVKNDDPTFGDLFYGSISFRIKKFMEAPLAVSAGFGKLPTYRYWFTDVAVPVDIPLGSTMKLKSIYGGIQKRVQSTLTDQQQLSRVAGNINTQSSNLIPFIPDQTQGLQFRAGVAIDNNKEDVFNSEAMFTVAFNPSGGFQSFNFTGQAYMMVNRSQRNSGSVKKVHGLLNINYDNEQKVFDASLAASIYVPNTMTGSANLTIHVDSTDWYFWLNRPTNRAYVNVYNMFYVNAYFMVGTQIDPIPPPPSYIVNAVGPGAISTADLTAAGTGDGFAMGVEFGTQFGGEFPDDTEWRGFVNVQVGAGFDLMLFNASNYHCSGSSDPVGVNGYYCYGQVYAYLNGALGVKRYKTNGDINTYNLGSMQVAALLQGKFPKPTFIYGAINVQANVLNIIDFNFTADVEFGNDCSLVTY